MESKNWYVAQKGNTDYGVVESLFKQRGLKAESCRFMFDCAQGWQCCRDLGFCMQDLNECAVISNQKQEQEKSGGTTDLTCSEDKACPGNLSQKCCNGVCQLEEVCQSLNKLVGSPCQQSTPAVEWNECDASLECRSGSCAQIVNLNSQELAGGDADAEVGGEVAAAEEGLDDMTLGFIIGGSVLGLILIIVTVVLIMKKKNQNSEVPKHPLSQDDSSQKSQMDYTTQNDKGNKDETSQKMSDDGSQLELESIDESENTEKDSRKKKGRR